MTATDDLMDKWMNRAPGYDCLICGARANHEIALMNLYATRLCLDHSNEFHEYSIKRGWLRKVHQLEKVRDAHVIANRGKIYQMDAVRESTRDVDMYKDKLYYECKRWVNKKRMEVDRARAESEEPKKPETEHFEGQV